MIAWNTHVHQLDYLPTERNREKDPVVKLLCAFLAFDFLDSDRSRSKKKKKRSDKQRSLSPLNKRMFGSGIDASIDPSTAAFQYSKMFAGASTSDANLGDYETKVSCDFYHLRVPSECMQL